MERKARWIFILTFILSLAAVIFLSASMGTEYWIESFPTRKVDNKTEHSANNVTGGDPGTKFKGYIHFGLFHGNKYLDYGLGLRGIEISVPDAITEYGLMDFGMWVSTVVFLALAIAMGLVSMGFSALNASTKPIETITGPMGLYIWNAIAIIFILVCMVLYLLLYFLHLRENILSPRDVRERWSSSGTTGVYYSFYLLLVAVLLHAANVLVVALSGVRLKPIRYGHNLGSKAMDGVMMY